MASFPSRRSRAGSSLFTRVSTGVWCWVCTNHVEQQAPARISAVSRATELGAPDPPYATGALTPSSPDRLIASILLAGTPSWSTRSA